MARKVNQSAFQVRAVAALALLASSGFAAEVQRFHACRDQVARDDPRRPQARARHHQHSEADRSREQPSVDRDLVRQVGRHPREQQLRADPALAQAYLGHHER